jgi:hypothetical protein
MMCCASGKIDECGVCDGDSSSCKLKISTKIQLNPSAQLLSTADLIAQLKVYFAALMKTQADRIVITLGTSSRRRLLTGMCFVCT